jgi:hypothetical protein
LPARSFGSAIPAASFTKMAAWRKMRDGNTGMAMNGRSAENSETA